MNEYQKSTLNRVDLDSDPLNQFSFWFEEAKKTEIEAEAMCLATATSQGTPSCRMVLLKGFDSRGFLFFTNSHSKKGRNIQENPKASLNFYWPSLERQVIIEGAVVKASVEESDAYFASRPRASKLGAWASDQDAPIASRDDLEKRFSQIVMQLKNKDVIPRPPYWEGYRILAFRFEFWQGRKNRLHDRFAYDLDGPSWIISRLSP